MGQGPLRDLGPCQIVFNGQDLGPSLGGVQFKYNTEQRPVREDQFGSQDVDAIFTGSQCEISVPLTRTTLSLLASVIPGGRISDNIMLVETIAGTAMYANAAALVLKPYADGVPSTDESEWITIPKAYPVADLELQFDNEQQRVFKVVFKAFMDQTQDPPVLFKIGA